MGGACVLQSLRYTPLLQTLGHRRALHASRSLRPRRLARARPYIFTSQGLAPCRCLLLNSNVMRYRATPYLELTALVTLLVVIVAACITVLFVKALKPTSAGAFAFFACWLVLPHAVMSTALVLLWRKRAASVHLHVVAVLVSIGGIVFLTDAKYHKVFPRKSIP